MASTEHDGRAGGYAQARFELGRRRWRVRIRGVAIACFGPFMLLGVLVPLLVPGALVVWGGGVAFGAGLIAFVTVADSPPAYVENWRRGAEGERRTARRLRRLQRAGWLVLHDIQNGRGNYDHVLVGPAGVFLLDTKWPAGTMRIVGGVPRVRRREDPEAEAAYDRYRPGVLAAAARLHGELTRHGCSYWVHAVVVVWCDFEAGVYEEDRWAVVHGSQLIDWLLARPARLEEAEVAKLAAAVGALAGAAASRAP